jgi:L-2-hydroxyglutarate oxidase LhgO
MTVCAVGVRLQRVRGLVSAATADAVDAEVAVIGAGVVGLAIARCLAAAGREVLLLEAAGAPGSGTSSRSSEVIHAGIYYPAASLKARACVAGKRLLYDFCQRHDVPHRRLGKLVVATRDNQHDALRALGASAAAAGVSDLRWLSAADARALEPALSCTAALLSPSTGILDTHALMDRLQAQLEALGGTVALHSRVQRGDVAGAVKRLTVRDAAGGGAVDVTARAVVNAAGRHAQRVAASLVGLPAASIPPLHLAKGSYFTLASGAAPFSRLIYPLPASGGLGTHLTLDLGGAARFGPDVEWLPGSNPERIDYAVRPSRGVAFEAAVREYYPALAPGALVPAYAGVRPKVAGPAAPAGDFVVAGPRQHGVPGVVSLFGVESPGITASLALAELVAAQLAGTDA